MSYVGNTPTQQAFTPAIDYFSGNGSTVAFTLSRPVASVAQVQVVVNNVPQNPSTAFTVLNNTITFTGAPSSGTNNIYVEYTSPITQVVQPGQGTVGTTQLVDGSITTAKLASSFITPEANGGTGTTTGYYGFKNRIINGAMVIDQRNAGASVTANDGIFGADRWKYTMVASSKGTTQQSTTAPAGFASSILFTSSAATSVGSSDYYWLDTRIEGNNVADMGFGTANASTFTVSFWVRSSLTGTFGGSFENSASNRSYPFSYTISAANTWEQKTVTVAGDTSGTWLTNNGVGLRVIFSLGVGSTRQGTANAWASADYQSPSGCVNVVGTSGATFYITGVQLEKGTAATSFDYRPYGTELVLCQRYFWNNVGNQSGAYYDTTGVGMYLLNPVPMRTAPTVTAVSLTLDVINVGTPTMTPSIINTDVTGFRISGIASSGATVGHPVGISNSSARMPISAEL